MKVDLHVFKDGYYSAKVVDDKGIIIPHVARVLLEIGPTGIKTIIHREVSSFWDGPLVYEAIEVPEVRGNIDLSFDVPDELITKKS